MKPDETTAAADPLVVLARMEGVASALVAARDGVDVLLRDRGLRTVPPATSAQALLAGARASIRLEPDPERWRGGTGRMATELIPLASTIRTAPGQVLARLHLLLTQGVLPNDQVGRVADGVDTERLSALTRLLTTRTTAPTMVLAAIAHAEIQAIAPFTGTAREQGPDGVIARAVEHLVLIEGGIDPAGVVVVEQGHADAPEEYRVTLSRYARGSAAGVRDWLVHCTRAIARGVEVSPLRPAGSARKGPAQEDERHQG